VNRAPGRLPDFTGTGSAGEYGAMAIAVRSTSAPEVERQVAPPVPGGDRRPSADDETLGQPRQGTVAVQRPSPTTSTRSAAGSATSPARTVVWRAGHLTVPQPDPLIRRLLRRGAVVTATAIASAALLQTVATWSILPGVGPTPASRLWVQPAQAAADDRSPDRTVTADVPAAHSSARPAIEQLTPSVPPWPSPTHTAVLSHADGTDTTKPDESDPDTVEAGQDQQRSKRDRLEPKPDRAKPDEVEPDKPEPGKVAPDTPNKSDTPDEPQPDKPDAPKPDEPDKANEPKPVKPQPVKGEQPAKPVVERPAKPEKVERPDKPVVERPARAEKVERPARAEKVERPATSDEAENADHDG